MKRGYTESPSTSLGPPQSRIKHNPDGDAFLEDESTKIFARKVADHYSARTNQTLEEREASGKLYLLLLGTTALSLVTTPLLFKLIPAVVHLGVLLRWFSPDSPSEVKERTANANDFVNGGSHVMEYGSRSIRAEKLYLYQKVLILPLLTSHPTITNYTWLWKL
ncbi:hypothetical protein G4B88_011050 [Cannabis sativa]|uniref:Uncharacterized protein n=1 Tax=Cannabis sativa TaxID=3483 RepID=A0A7J6DL48_CANSA|nr:hypothetical protein G4B88_011050 [Cannabis sativa]